MLAAAALLAAGLGYIVVRSGSATSFVAGSEAEAGVPTGDVRRADDDRASAGQHMAFGGQPVALAGLLAPGKKEMAMRIVSSAENSTLDWRAQFGYIEDIGDGRGYTAGIIGFCSGTGDMLELVERYTARKPGNVLAKYLPALRAVNGSDSHQGLGEPFEADWRAAAADVSFQDMQETERDRVYFGPAVALAVTDGLRTLGQFAYYDAAVMHGPDAWGGGLPDIRRVALQRARPPAQGGIESAWLHAFLDARAAEMRKEAAHEDVSRVETAQRKWLQEGNLDLNAPISWTMYGDPFTIRSEP